jgi:multimeric flavodoxin WrbA
MRALILDCTSAIAPDSDVEIATKTMIESLQRHEVEVETLRILDADLEAPPDGSGPDQRWVELRDQILGADILLLASPATWLGQPSDEARTVLEGMAALLAERDATGQVLAVNHVAGVVVAGDRMGGEMVLSEVTAALTQLGFTVPGHATTYLNTEALTAGPLAVREQSALPGREAASNLVAVAQALREHPIPPPDGDAPAAEASGIQAEPAEATGAEDQPEAAAAAAPPAAGTGGQQAEGRKPAKRVRGAAAAVPR